MQLNTPSASSGAIIAILKIAVESINEGQIFHYLNKPWDEIDHKYTIIQALVFHDLSRRNEVSANNLKGKIQNLQR